MSYFDNSISYGRALVDGLARIDTQQLRELAKNTQVYELPLAGRNDEQVPLDFSEYKGLNSFVTEKTKGKKFAQDFMGALRLMNKGFAGADGLSIGSALEIAKMDWPRMGFSAAEQKVLEAKLNDVLTVIAGYRDFADGLCPGASDFAL